MIFSNRSRPVQATNPHDGKLMIIQSCSLNGKLMGVKPTRISVAGPFVRPAYG
ncbi:hypothetical protein RSAG8_02989, partial [Rhizoctonia solani AG-8 WAC10335]